MTTSDAQPFSKKNWMANVGLKAKSTCGALMMEMMPVTARVPNQIAMTGPNAHATRSLPLPLDEEEADGDSCCDEEDCYPANIFKSRDQQDALRLRRGY